MLWRVARNVESDLTSISLSETSEAISAFLLQVHFHKGRMPTDPTQMNPAYAAEIIGSHSGIVGCAAKQTPLLRKETGFLSVRMLPSLVPMSPDGRQR